MSRYTEAIGIFASTRSTEFPDIKNIINSKVSNKKEIMNVYFP
ncbi:hypothetical protein [Chryseobacterium sp. M5A1_1a]